MVAAMNSIALPLGLILGALLLGVPARADLGWKESDYGKRYGTATKSAVTPDQIRYDLAGGGMLLVRLVGGRSEEELWVIDVDERVLPAALAKQARAVIAKGKPVSVVRFKVPHAPPAELYESVTASRRLRIDVRNQALRRVALCQGSKPCLLFDQALSGERQVDGLVAPSARDVERRSH